MDDVVCLVEEVLVLVVDEVVRILSIASKVVDVEGTVGEDE
jgi:hypothetical protein